MRRGNVEGDHHLLTAHNSPPIPSHSFDLFPANPDFSPTFQIPSWRGAFSLASVLHLLQAFLELFLENFAFIFKFSIERNWFELGMPAVYQSFELRTIRQHPNMNFCILRFLFINIHFEHFWIRWIVQLALDGKFLNSQWAFNCFTYNE